MQSDAPKSKVVKRWSICRFWSLVIFHHYLCRATYRQAWVSRHKANEDGGKVSTAAARAAAGLPANSRASTTLVVYAHVFDKKTGSPGEAG